MQYYKTSCPVLFMKPATGLKRLHGLDASNGPAYTTTARILSNERVPEIGFYESYGRSTMGGGSDSEILR